ncbi:hypothetical protein INR49_014724 [Caranx melampygus]|nr:hypothetical protein INR49_014724 [Caranx melampygus]
MDEGTSLPPDSDEVLTWPDQVFASNSECTPHARSVISPDWVHSIRTAHIDSDRLSIKPKLIQQITQLSPTRIHIHLFAHCLVSSPGSSIPSLVATTTMEPSSASSSFSSSDWTTQGVTSNGILSAADSAVCAGSPGLEPLVDGASSLSGDGVKEHGSGSKIDLLTYQ